MAFDNEEHFNKPLAKLLEDQANKKFETDPRQRTAIEPSANKTITIPYCTECDCPIGSSGLCSYECKLDGNCYRDRPVVQKVFEQKPSGIPEWMANMIQAAQASQKNLTDITVHIIMSKDDTAGQLATALQSMSFVKDQVEKALAAVPEEYKKERT